MMVRGLEVAWAAAGRRDLRAELTSAAVDPLSGPLWRVSRTRRSWIETSILKFDVTQITLAGVFCFISIHFSAKPSTSG